MNNHYENNDVDRLYARVWGGGFHFGIYDSGTETIEEAAYVTRERMIAASDATKAQRVLEVGSGYGTAARHLAGKFDGRIIATNIAPNHNTIAAAKTLEAGLDHRISLALADYHSLPFPDNEFDLYWCQESFVHATDKTRVMAEAFRVLAPGGKIVFTDQTTNRDACLPEESEIIARRHGSPDLCDADDFVTLLEKAGFVVTFTEDWSPNMTRHFEKLVERIEETWDLLSESIDEDVLRRNYENWCKAAQYSLQGKMGWYCFVAQKHR